MVVVKISGENGSVTVRFAGADAGGPLMADDCPMGGRPSWGENAWLMVVDHGSWWLMITLQLVTLMVVKIFDGDHHMYLAMVDGGWRQVVNNCQAMVDGGNCGAKQ